ncbi:hypothetical protein N7465_008204 [Penicillium sp. CMV-2018d]|nr:hypothetical protein N7465_008204 [Penicillium sp. CMV-2018d]
MTNISLQIHAFEAEVFDPTRTFTRAFYELGVRLDISQTDHSPTVTKAPSTQVPPRQEVASLGSGSVPEGSQPTIPKATSAPVPPRREVTRPDPDQHILSEFDDPRRKELIEYLANRYPAHSLVNRKNFFAFWFADIGVLRFLADTRANRKEEVIRTLTNNTLLNDPSLREYSIHESKTPGNKTTQKAPEKESNSFNPTPPPPQLPETHCTGLTNLRKRQSSPFDPSLLPELKKLAYNPRKIVKDDRIMNILEQKEIGKPLATYIRDLANPGRPIRFTSWKSPGHPTREESKLESRRVANSSQEVVHFTSMSGR